MLSEFSKRLANIRFYIDYTSESSGCNGHCDDYCRCQYIVSTTIEDPVSHNYVAQQIAEANGVADAISQYAFARLLWLKGVRFLPKDFEVEVVGGYYGQETNGCVIDLAAETTATVFDCLQIIASCSGYQEALRVSLCEEYDNVPELDMVITVTNISLDRLAPTSNGRRVPYDGSWSSVYGVVVNVGSPRKPCYQVLDGAGRLNDARAHGVRTCNVIELKLSGPPKLLSFGDKRPDADSHEGLLARLAAANAEIAVLRRQLAAIIR